MPEVAVLIVCFNGREFLADCLRSVLDSDDANLTRHVIVIDNASTDGSVNFLRDEFPKIDLICLPKNIGFAGANNAGWEYARRKFPKLEFIALLNPDTIVQSGWQAKLAEHLQANPAIAAVQPKILLWPEKTRFNTAGNQSHFLGFGIVSAYGQVDDGSRDTICEIDFPSGAAALLRTDVIRKVGLFDELFFLYLEDADLGWKIRQMGYQIDYLPAAVVWHRYTFQRDYQYYYFLERNRWILLATYYKTPTLLLLLPIFIAMEIGQLFFAWRNKIICQKFRAWGFFLSWKNVVGIMRRRREAQQRRQMSDRMFVKNFIAEIDFPEIRSRTLRVVGNPLLRIYWRLIRWLIVW